VNALPPLPVRTAAKVLLAWLAVAALSACGSSFKRGSERPGTPSSSATRQATTYLAPEHREIGRILFYDAAAQTALIEISPFIPFPPDLIGRALIVRHPDTLAPSARLVASGRRSGSILGAYVMDGTPAPGHEVVLPPAP